MRTEENRHNEDESERDPDMDCASYYNHRKERWSQGHRQPGDQDRKRETSSYNSMTSGTGRDNSFFGGGHSSFQGDGWAGANSQGRTHFGKGPKGWKRSDDRIREEACEALYHAHSVDASEIEVSVKDGCVSLKGTVESREAKREAERVIDRVSGVADVYNELRVSRGMENSPTMNSSTTGTSSSSRDSSDLSQ